MTIPAESRQNLKDLLVLVLARNSQRPFGEQADAIIDVIEQLAKENQ